MKLLSFICVGVLSALAACDVPVEDGIVATQYLGMATPYMGVFEGEFDGQAGTIRIEFDAANHPTVQLEGFYDGSLIKKCEAKIGLLKGVQIRRDKKTGEDTLRSATFAFDAGSRGRCVDYDETIRFHFRECNGRTELEVELHARRGAEWSDDYEGRFVQVAGPIR